MPFSMLLIGVNEAKTILNILALIACSYIAIANYKYINKKRIFKNYFIYANWTTSWYDSVSKIYN
jgi:hypothetical protein